MILTMDMLDLEVNLTGAALRDATRAGWRYWRDADTRRKPYRPDHIAINENTGLGLAIFTRPRRLAPSEMPKARPLPAGVVPVLWYPKLKPQIVAWLAMPLHQPPPGLFTPTGRQDP